MWVVRIIPAIFITPVYGLVGFWVCMAVELTFRGSLFLIRLRRGTWLKGVV
jgi:Na+-driven multidrug efflux pump